MRVVDTKSLNKRLFKEITELKDMVDKISPENVKYFDSDLIKSALNYTGILKDSIWADNSNFNGIEMSKIRQMLDGMKINKKRIFISRKIFNVQQSTNPNLVDGFLEIDVPELFDGRNSFVYSQIEIKDSEGLSHASPIYKYRNFPNGGKFIARKNKTKITIEYYFDLGFAFEWVAFDIFYILWR